MQLRLSMLKLRVKPLVALAVSLCINFFPPPHQKHYFLNYCGLHTQQKGDASATCDKQPPRKEKTQ